MQTPCSPLDASQLLRDILQSKEHQYTSTNIKEVYNTDCSSAISPILNSKSSDMAFNDRDNTNDIDNDNDNDGDIDVAADNNSCVNDDDQSDDLDETSLDASVQGSKLKTIDSEGNVGESKEAKRAHVEIILTSMKQSPPRDSRDSSSGILAGDFKRQKRKQPQPQQHESSALDSEELALRRQIQQLQEQMQAVKRKREEDMPVNYDDDDDAVVDDDLTDDEASKPSSPFGGELKRARMDHMLSGIRSSSPMENGFEFSNRISPGSDSSKKQKRKQTQPQQHDNNNRLEHREGASNAKHNDNAHRITSKLDDISVHIEDGHGDPNTPSGMYGTDSLFRNSLYRSLGNKDLIPPLQNGFDHHFYREHFLRQNIFGMRPDLDPVTVFRSKALQIRAEQGKTSDGQTKISHMDSSHIANALKAEITQAMNKAIDLAVNKVLSEKQACIQSSQSSMAAESSSQQQPQDRQIQQQSSQQQQQQQQKLSHTSNIFPNFLQQHPQQHQQFQQQHRLYLHQQQQQQQQQQQHQQNTQSSQVSEREVHKDTLNSSSHQAEKKPELIVPFSDHLHFLERFGNRLHQEKMSAFDPLHKSESELITPHTGPAIPFHPHFPYYLPTQVIPSMYTGEPEQTEALPLLTTPKKKRTKVTDTRLSSPRGKPALMQDNTPMDHADAQRHMAAAVFPHFLPPVLPTSVAITNPSLTHSEILALRLQEATYRESRVPSPKDQSRGSPRSPTDSPHYLEMYGRGSMGMTGDPIDGSSPGNGLMTSTLTPMHLRKAKLMFFYTRYPSSSILKMYFPDVMFNKNNTAQLVKWFSNFREFFYIQMEKYARQALAEGCKHADDLIITADSELFRHLNLHYNRNNQLEVPHNFMAAVQAALKEFFKAIQSNKDAEPSWKKAIYKIIARMDETLPDFFKSPNWIEQLGDQ